MVVEVLHILPTDTSPEIILNPEGIIKIKGRALVVNNTEVPAQIMIWIDNYLIDAAETTFVIIAFEYLNSFSTTILVSILKRLSRVKQQSKKLLIQWHYEEDDEDIYERGKYISETYDIPIEFIITNDISDL